MTQPELFRTVTIEVLVSVGRHPVTGRPGRADHDARAVELALGITADTRLLHAGPLTEASETALRGYLGMGIECVSMIEQDELADVSTVLVEALQARAPALVVMGTRAEQGEGSGMLPYLLARALGWALVPRLVGVESVDDARACVLQSQPGGQRRRLSVQWPFIATVDDSAPSARQSAFGPARRGRIAITHRPNTPDEALAAFQVGPARPRPKRLKLVTATSARDRFKAAAAKSSGAGGRILTDVSPQTGAEAILALLEEQGMAPSRH